MKRWLFLILLCVLPLCLAWAEPFLSIKGPIMETRETTRVIVVNEMSIFVQPSTPIIDKRERSLDFGDLKPGRWVSVDVEPEGNSRMIATKIVVIRGE